MQPSGADARVLTRLHLPAGDGESPAQARAALRDALGDRVAPDVLEDALLVASELVANAVLHAGVREGGTIDFCVRVDGHIRIDVRDRGRGFTHPEAGPSAGRRFGGRGLGIVATVSDRWGIVEDDGVLVWAELALVRDPRGREPR